MDMAVVFEWFGQIRAAAQAHEPRQREIWTRWAMLWGGLAVVHCRHEEAGMIGEDAAVYLSGDGPRTAAGVGPYDVGDE